MSGHAAKTSACSRCSDTANEVSWCEALNASVCLACFNSAPELSTTASSKTVVPQASGLKPSTTNAAPSGLAERTTCEAEFEGLLRLHGAGDIEPVPVALPPLGPTASPAAREIAEFVALVRGLRLAAGDERDVPLALRWVASKTGWPQQSVSRALSWLVANGVLVRGETLPAQKYGRGTQCYRPADAGPRLPDELAARRRPPGAGR